MLNKVNYFVYMDLFKNHTINLLKNFKLYFISTLFIIASIYSTIVPPFQSLDEYEHITRTYLLAKGQILLDNPVGKIAGGYLDDGLIHYMGIPFLFPDKTITKNMIQNMESIRWSRTESFYVAPGTSYYFPAIYAPQAVGLLTGQILDLSIDDSYRLARFFAFAVSLIFIIMAFKIFPPNFLVMGLLIMPMSIFQMTSTTIDGLTFTLTILSLSLFMRGANLQNSFPTWMSILLTCSLLVLINCRNHLLPLSFLPLFIFLIRKDKINLWLFLSLISFTLFWIFITFTRGVVVTPKIGEFRNPPTSKIFINYILHPLDFFKIFYASLRDSAMLNMYAKGFVGWLYDPFKNYYFYTAIFLFLMVTFSISYSTIRNDYVTRLFLIFLSILSIFIIFFSMLMVFTSPNSDVIEGVQGRYFIPVAIILAFALSGNGNVFKYPQICFAIPLIFLWGLLLSVALTATFLTRYYLP